MTVDLNVFWSSWDPSLRVVTFVDTADNPVWDIRSFYYDAENTLVGRDILNDTGIRVINQYEYAPGPLPFKSFKLDTLDIFNWTEISWTYSGGQLTSRNFLMDNGIAKFESYEDGALTSRVCEDLADIRNWTTFTSFFSPLGVLEASRRVFDSGIVNDSTFAGGRIASKLLTDVEDIRGWDTQLTTWDPETNDRTVTITFDAGNARTTSYDGNTITQMIKEDLTDRFGWTKITWDYDPDDVEITFSSRNVTFQKTTEFDDGRVKIELNDRGFVWLERIEFNDADGTTQETEARSNGITRVRTEAPDLYRFEEFFYSDGDLRGVQIFDLSGAANLYEGFTRFFISYDTNNTVDEILYIDDIGTELSVFLEPDGHIIFSDIDAALSGGDQTQAILDQVWASIVYAPEPDPTPAFTVSFYNILRNNPNVGGDGKPTTLRFFVTDDMLEVTNPEPGVTVHRYEDTADTADWDVIEFQFETVELTFQSETYEVIGLRDFEVYFDDGTTLINVYDEFLIA